VPNKNYISGRRAEYRAIRDIIARGAILAQRSAGSHSPVDVWAVMPDGSVLMIQVKKDSSPLDIDKLKTVPCAPPNRRQIWWLKAGKWEIIDL